MSSVLHPVGPEAPQTYWVRRALVLGTALLLLIVVIGLVASQASNGSVVAAPSPTPTPSPAIPTYTATPTPTPTAQASASDAAKTSAKASTSAKKPTASPKATKTPEPVLAACPADELRPTLTGKQRLKTKQSNTFTVSLINGSQQACALNLNAENFELKVYSGTDRIWTSRDCTRLVKAVKKKLAPERALEWKIVWNGRRSRDECKSRPEIPRAGTYFATAQFEGAKPVQLRMILR